MGGVERQENSHRVSVAVGKSRSFESQSFAWDLLFLLASRIFAQVFRVSTIVTLGEVF